MAGVPPGRRLGSCSLEAEARTPPEIGVISTPMHGACGSPCTRPLASFQQADGGVGRADPGVRSTILYPTGLGVRSGLLAKYSPTARSILTRVIRTGRPSYSLIAFTRRYTSIG